MAKTLITLAVAACVGSSAAYAQQFSGGQLAIDVLGYGLEDDVLEVNYSGGLEYAINRNWSIGGYYTVYDFDTFDGSAGNLTLHAIYHLNDDTSVGVFRAGDGIELDGFGAGRGMTGIEAGYETGAFEVEGFIGFFDKPEDDDQADNALLFGLSGAYEINDTISVLASYSRADSDTLTANRFSVGGSYEFIAGPSVYANVGRADSGLEDASFIGLGASIEFGADRGMTFESRSLFDTINADFE